MSGKITNVSSSTVRFDAPGAFIEGLAAGAIVEFYDGPASAPWLAFTLQSGGAAIHVVTPQGQIVGVFATALAAAVYGFRRLDRAGKAGSSRRSKIRSEGRRPGNYRRDG